MGLLLFYRNINLLLMNLFIGINNIFKRMIFVLFLIIIEIIIIGRTLKFLSF